MNETPLILSLDTATVGGSICLSRGAEVLTSLGSDSQTSHSNALLGEIEQVLATGGVSLAQVDLFAVALGPGSFTGLRIGLASVKAFAGTLNVPCVGIPTLQGIAHSAGPSPATVSLLPAGRGEVFAQLFAVSETGLVSAVDEPAHLPPIVMLAKYGMRHNLKWAGPGAHAQRATIAEYADSNGIEFGEAQPAGADWLLAGSAAKLAINIAALAWQRYQQRQLESAASLQAIYVRPSDAELNQK